MSIYALTFELEKSTLDSNIQGLKYEIDNVIDRLRSDKVSSCMINNENHQVDSQGCFAYSMALIFFDTWRSDNEFPIAGVPSCKDIEEYISANDEIYGISVSFQRQWVAEYTDVEAIHPSCVSQEFYKRKNALGFDTDYVVNANSVRDNIFHISELMPCYYRYCTVLVFRPYAIELERIDAKRGEIASKYADVMSKEQYISVLRLFGYFLVCIAIALRLTKTSAERRHLLKDSIEQNYYETFGENEWHRLTWPEGIIEFAITTHVLNKYLPQYGRVLDLGGGPGRYSIWLAQRNYRVVLADLSPHLLDIAQDKIIEADVQAQIEEVIVCDACDLSHFEDETFDAVLCLGPFYHLVEPADRERAAVELVRVLKPDGLVFVAFMPIYTFLRRTLVLKEERHHLTQSEFVTRLMNEGIFLNDVANKFNTGYGVHPGEGAPFLEKYGLKTIDLLADTSFAAPYAQQLAELAASDPKAYETVMEIIISTANDPSILGTSIHLLYVGQKRR